VYVHPAEGERYYLRVLLNHVRGATSFGHLRSQRGTTYAIFRDACEALGYVDTDKSLDDCLTESAQFKMPCALRRLFATIIVFCKRNNVRALWDKHIDSMSDDIIVAQMATPKWLNKWCLEIYLYMLKIWVEKLQTMDSLS